MSKPQYRQIGRVGNDIPPAVAKILRPVKESIELLTGDSDLAAIRRANFLALLRTNQTFIRDLARPVTTTPSGSTLDQSLRDLEQLNNEVRRDAAELFRRVSLVEVEALRSLEEFQVEVDKTLEHGAELVDHANDLADHAIELLNHADDIEALQDTVDDPSTGLIATATALSATIARVDDAEDLLDVQAAQITALQSELIDTSALDPGIMWQFEASEDSWTSNATLTTHATYITIGALASTHFTSPSAIAIDGAKFSRIVARVRRVSGTGWLGRASYATSGGGSHGIDTTNYQKTIVTEPTFAGGGWVIISWDMEALTAGGSDWVSSTIDQIRLELSDDNATVYEVDWVAIGRVAPSYVTATVNALEARVTQTEDDIDALSSSVTSLETDVSGLEGDVSTNSSAISSLNTRVTTAEGNITTLNSSVTSLDSRLDDAEADLTAAASALSSLDTRLDSAEGTISAHSTSITSLDTRLDTAEGTISTTSSALSTLTSRVDQTEDDIAANSTSITSLNTSMTTANSNIAANSSAITALDTRLDSAEGTISSHSTALTSLDARLDDAEGELIASAFALQSLDVRVTQTETGVTTQASQLSLLEIRRGGSDNMVNPLTTAGDARDWSVANSSVLNSTIGGRTSPAARIRTNTSIEEVTTTQFAVQPRGIYEIRISVLKNLAHGYMYFGLTGRNESNSEVQVTPIRNQAIVGAPYTNPYFTYVGSVSVDHSLFTANAWYDLVFYVLGSEADAADCPDAKINNSPVSNFSNWGYAADGFRLPSGSRRFNLRVLNYYNATQTDMWFNNVTIRRIDNQDTAAIKEESVARSTADGVLSLEKTVKIDVNGYVVGYGLSVVGGTSGPVQSSMIFSVDRFAVAFPGFNPVVPFVIANVNGVPTVGISGNLVVDGSIIARNFSAGALGKLAFTQRTIALNSTDDVSDAISSETDVYRKRALINVNLNFDFLCFLSPGQSFQPVTIQVWLQFSSDGVNFGNISTRSFTVQPTVKEIGPSFSFLWALYTKNISFHYVTAQSNPGVPHTQHVRVIVKKDLTPLTNQGMLITSNDTREVYLSARWYNEGVA